MGITFESIERMDRLGLFGKGRTSILDIGSSNLYSANPEQIKRFLKKYAPADVQDAIPFAETLARGSGYDPVRGGLNESFAGQLFEKAGMEYLAFDIADGYRTQILDLNHATLPKNLQGHFDLVLNFGTTEHILNQYNCFKVIHDATKLGGYIHHSLPGTGYGDHGYITYTCRCFFDIAGYNEYEIVDFWFEGPGGRNDLLQGLRSYSGYFPVLKQSLNLIEKSPQGAAIQDAAPCDLGINIVCRKVKNKPFWGALESSTSVGVIPGTVTATYAGGTRAVEQVSAAESASDSGTKSQSAAHSLSQALRAYPLIHAVSKRVYTSFFGKPASTVSTVPAASTTSTPSPEQPAALNLTEDETSQLNRLLNGNMTFEESLQFYSAIVEGHGSFPYPWEERILRLGIAKHPDRRDMVERLEVVLGLQGQPTAKTSTVKLDAAESAATPSPESFDPGSAESLQLRIADFGSRTLSGLADPSELDCKYQEVAGEAIGILSSPAFSKLPVPRQIEAIIAVHNTTMSALLREAVALADLISGHFVRLLKEGELKLPDAMHLYDCLYGLYFAGARSITEMGRFDLACVLPFEAYLKTGYSPLLASGRTKRIEKIGENICYFCHCAHFEKGNAVSPIMASLARSHAKREDRKIYLYCVQWVSQAFVDSFAGSGVIVRQFQQDWRYDKLDVISDQLKADDIDVVITDLNSSIASVLFARRVAPLQMWIVMAYPYWSLKSMDWALLPVLDYQPGYGIDAERVSALKIKQETATLIQVCDDAALNKARSSLPEGKFIFAVFSRLIKVSREFLELMVRILREEPRAHILLVGTGDPRTLHEIAADALSAGRITFIHGNVDLNVYGRVVDVMLDTFPFHGGNACREVAIHGKPVLSLREAEWGQFLDEERDAAVLAKDVDEYVAIALRLAREADFYAARSAEARQVAIRVTHTGDMIAEVEQAIAKARTKQIRSETKTQLQENAGKPLSQLEQLIVRNVAGKNGGVPFYPGQPDPMAQQFRQFANELFLSLIHI